MPEPGKRHEVTLSLKICLAGDGGVGKSSLVRRFVSDTFDDRYTSTLGAKVSSRRFSVPDPWDPQKAHEVGATIWDIMGNLGFREVLKDAFFHGVQAVLLVCDATRPETFHGLAAWMKAVRSVASEVPAIVLVNKSDLAGEIRVTDAAAGEFSKGLGARWMFTSAKTGENVAEAFNLAARMHLDGVQGRRAGGVAPR